MKKAFTLALLLFGMACLSFAAPLKVDPGTGITASPGYTFEHPLAIVPAFAPSQIVTAIDVAFGTVILATIILVARRKPKSPLLRMRGSAVLNYLKNRVGTYMSRLFAYRAKSTWLKSRGSSDLKMMSA